MTNAKGVGDPQWGNHVIATLKLRYDALTTRELGMYQELMEKRGIPVPEWFKEIRTYVDTEKSVLPGMIPDQWTPRKINSKMIVHDVDEPEYVEVTCTSCKLSTLVPNDGTSQCYTCEEYHRITRELSVKIYDYDTAVEATRFHLPDLTSKRVYSILFTVWVLWAVAWGITMLIGMIP